LEQIFFIILILNSSFPASITIDVVNSLKKIYFAKYTHFSDYMQIFKIKNFYYIDFFVTFAADFY